MKDSHFSGTTALGYFYKNGIILGVDSRCSNQSSHDIDPLEIRIYDDACKMYVLPNKMACIMIGNAKESHELRGKLKDLGSVSTSELYRAVENHMNKKKNTVKAFAIIMARFNSQKRELHSFTLGDADLYMERNKELVALGSGREHALKILNDEMKNGDGTYNHELSQETTIDLMKRAIFNGTYYDKLSGGPFDIRYTNHTTEEWNKVDGCQDIMKLYLDFYRFYDNEKTLFLVYHSSNILKRVHGNELIHYFSAHATALKAHCVVRLSTGEQSCIFFHRLLFANNIDATKVYEFVRDKGIQTGSKGTPIFQYFPNHVRYFYPSGHLEGEELKLYVDKSSEELLRQIISNSSVNYETRAESKEKREVLKTLFNKANR